MTINGQNTVFRGGRKQISFRIAVKPGETVIYNAFGITFVKSCKANSIKSNQPVKGRKPEIAVRRLRNFAQTVLRQTIIRRPGIKTILSEYGVDGGEAEIEMKN